MLLLIEIFFILEKGGVEARAGAQALRRERAGAKAETKRRVRRGAGVVKKKEAAAKSVTAAAPRARSDLGGTELVGAPCM